MAVTSAKLSPVAKPTPPAPVVEQQPERWVEHLRLIAIVCFVSLAIAALLFQPLAGRLVWTVAVAGLPLFIVLVGYHRWRRICPLAFIAQLPTYLKRPGRRKASPWLEANYYYVAFTVFLFSLWTRLIAMNGDGYAIAGFFALISFAALTVGFLYSGKTWCNYICPVSFIEKIYTEPYGLRETPNSQCPKCTACKKNCPDINEENAYWKELEWPSRRVVCFAFPGVVFAFYFYYYLQAGTWDYYFSSILTAQNQTLQWVNQPGLIRSAFLPGRGPETAGFFFLPQIPRAVASLLTLAAGAFAGFLVFRWLETLLTRWVRQRAREKDEMSARHLTLTLAAFTAFVIFYTFAAQPTLRKVNWLPQFFGLIVVFAATLSLVRRLARTQKAFAEDSLARNIIKRWKWADQQAPKNLHDAFLIHTVRQRESTRSYDQVLDAYNGALRETLADGYITHNQVQFLQSLRNQLQIKETDHEKIMAALAEEERTRITDPSEHISAEKRLQLETYSRALESYFARADSADEAPDDAIVRELRSEYCVTQKEHAMVLGTLLGSAGGAGDRLATELAIIEQSTETIRALERERTSAHDFLRDLLTRRRARAIDRLIRTSGFAPDDEAIRNVRTGLSSPDGMRRRTTLEEFTRIFSPAVAQRVLAAYRKTVESQASASTLNGRLQALQDCVDHYVRAVVILSLSERRILDAETLNRLTKDENEIVRDTALCLRSRESKKYAGNGTPWLAIVEKMIALRSAPIFSTLEPQELAELARSSTEEEYAQGKALCVEGTQGNEVFILLRGDVKVQRRDGLSGTEKAGSLIGEMAVLDPAPRAATVLAGANGASVLRLEGSALRDVVNTNPAIAYGVIRTLARRLRGG